MKTTYNTKTLAILLLTLLSSLLLACGGGSGGGGGDNSGNGGNGGNGGSGNLTQNAPTYDRHNGYFVDASSIDIEITASTAGATLRYTTNGSNPACNSGTIYASPVSVNVSSTTTIKARSCLNGYDDSPVSTGTYTQVTPDVNASAVGATPIADALAIAVDGDIVNVPAGTYTENLAGLTIDKRITLIGAGSGTDPASNTIIANSIGGSNTGVISITNGGTSESDRLEIRNIRVINSITGGNPPGNYGTGIMISTDVGHILFDNIIVTDNEGYGVAFNAAGSMDDLVVTNSSFSNNGASGFRTPLGDWYIDGLRFDNCIFNGNTGPGIMSYMYGTNANIFITNSTFENNAAGGHQYGDIVLSPFNGNVSFENVSIISNTSESGIRISGSHDGGSPRKGLASANINMTNVTISGIQQSNGTYPSAAMVISRYMGLANVVMSDVIFNSTAPHGLFLGTINDGTSPDLGNLELGVGFSNDIALGRHGNPASSSYADSTTAIDATGVTFVNAVSDADIRNRVWDNFYDGSLGTVTWTTP